MLHVEDIVFGSDVGWVCPRFSKDQISDKLFKASSQTAECGEPTWRDEAVLEDIVVPPRSCRIEQS
jgi:hypothetical protein